MEPVAHFADQKVLAIVQRRLHTQTVHPEARRHRVQNEEHDDRKQHGLHSLAQHGAPAKGAGE